MLNSQKRTNNQTSRYLYPPGIEFNCKIFIAIFHRNNCPFNDRRVVFEILDANLVPPREFVL